MPNHPIISFPRKFQNVGISTFAAIIIFITGCHKPVIKEQNYPFHADSIISRANMLLGSGKIDATLLYVDSAYHIFPQAGPVDLWKKYQLLYNFYLDYRLDTLKARLYTDSMRLILKGGEENHKAEFAHILFAEGDVLMAEKKYPEAFRRYYDGREYARENLDSCDMAQFNNKLALIRYYQMQMLKAILYFKQAIRENSGCPGKAGFDNRLMLPQSLLHMTGVAYGQLHTKQMKDSAVLYYMRALALIDQRAPEFPGHQTAVIMARGGIYDDLGAAYMWRFKDKQAIAYLTENIRINDRPGYDRMAAVSSKINLAYLYIRAGKLPQAANYIRQLEGGLRALQLGKWNKEGYLSNLYAIQWHYYDKKKQTDSAYHYFQKFTSYSDSLQKAAKERNEADMEGTFANSKSQYELALLNRDNRLKSVYLAAIILIAAMAITILLLVWFNLKRSRKTNQQISGQNEQLRQALHALEESQADNTRMMKMVAHDLRSPISSTISVTSLLLESGIYADKDQELLKLLKTSNLQSLDMITDLLNMNIQPENLKKEPVELQTLLRNCIDLLKFKAAEKQQQVLLAAQPVTLPLNREKLWRVISNLVTNAIKFSPAGSTIEVSLYSEAGWARVVVADQGIGIPPEIGLKIFDLFTEARRPGTAGEQSFGLGLAISKQIVEAHGGKLWFESQAGKGTTFFVELPVSPL
jgi:signal transduction histidine kinase